MANLNIKELLEKLMFRKTCCYLHGLQPKMHKCSGMQDILKGVLKYRTTIKGEIAQQLEKVGLEPKPESLLYTCVDSRVVATRFTQAKPGEYFIIRNPGNLIPQYSLPDKLIARGEEASMELACYHHDVHTVIVCGHSDCKAMNLVFSLRNEKHDVETSKSLLKDWVMVNTRNSLAKYFQAEKTNFKKPVEYSMLDKLSFKAYIDPENKFELHDKFSQINTLQQLENLRNFDLLKDKLLRNKLNFYALWFDVYSGEVYMFSFIEKSFIKIDDVNYNKLHTEFQAQN